MGGGSSSLFGGSNKSKGPSFGENSKKILKEFQIDSNGYFGQKGQSHSEAIREIVSNHPLSTAKHFFELITEGHVPESLPRGNGKIVKFSKDVVVTFRPVSTSNGSPAIDIKNDSGESSIVSQKIHFV